MKINFKNTGLKILINNKRYNFNLEKEINIKKIRKKYNDLVSDISLSNYKHLEYWSNNISERNTITSDHFLDFCYINLIKKHKKKEIQIFTNKLSIFFYFSKDSQIGIISKIQFYILFLFEKIITFKKVLFFLVQNLYIHLFYCNKKFKKNLNNSVILQTWISDFNFKNSNFFDLYNFNLKKKLQNKNKNKIYTWLIFNKVKNFKNVFKIIRDKNNEFLFIGDYLNLIDYFRSVLFYFKSKKINLDQKNLKNEKILNLFNYYNSTSPISYAILFFYFIEKIRKFKNINFLCHHENNIPEKILISSIKQFKIKSKIVGFFHSTKPNNLLYTDYASYKEYRISPKPDTVIFNSSFYTKFFKNKYKSENYINGFALKQNHLIKNFNKKNKGKKFVIILFTGDMPENKMILKILNTERFKHFNFLFRMHPMNNFKIKDYYDYDNYKIVNNIKINDLLKYNISKVITGYSGMAVEFQQRNLEVGLVANKEEIFLNPFDNLNITNYKIVYSSEELLKFVNASNLNKEKKVKSKVFNLKEKYYNSFYKCLI